MANNSNNSNNLLFDIEIVSPEGIIYSGEAEAVTVPTITGEITVLSNHENLFTKLGRGAAIIKSKGKQNSFAIMGGFLEVFDNKLRVISDFAIRAEDISTAQAEEARKRAEKAKKDAKDNQDFTEIEQDIQRSILQLNVADKFKRRRTRAD